MKKTENFRRLGLMIIGILTFHLAFAQENFISGQIINNDNDTLSGFVDYREWSKNPDEIKFKREKSDNPTSYKPMDIIQFSVQGEIYVSGIVDTEISPTQVNKLEEDAQINLVVDTLFLQALLISEKSLFYYKNADGKENFYIKQYKEFELLIYKRYTKQQGDQKVITEDKTYLSQLASYLNDCVTIVPKLKDTAYKRKSLVNFFQSYYECLLSDVYFQKKEKVGTEIGLLAGASLTSLNFSSDNFAFLVNAGYDSSIDFSGGLFFNIILPRNQRKWSIYNELLFSTYNVTGGL